MKKKIKKKFDINEPVFRTVCTFLVGWEFEEVKKYLNKWQHKDEPPIDDSHKFSDGVQFEVKNERGDISHIIWLKGFVYMGKDLGILVHEVSHLIFRIMTAKQIPIRDENDEVFCYLLEYYARNVIRKIL